MPQTITKWFLFSIILLRCVFLAFRDTTIYPFPLNREEGIPLSAYAWVMLEFLAMYLIVRQWWRDTRNTAVRAFLWMIIIDWIDFILDMNTYYIIWFGYKITNNMTMLALYLPVAWYLDKSRKHDIA